MVEVVPWAQENLSFLTLPSRRADSTVTGVCIEEDVNGAHVVHYQRLKQRHVETTVSWETTL